MDHPCFVTGTGKSSSQWRLSLPRWDGHRGPAEARSDRGSQRHLLRPRSSGWTESGRCRRWHGPRFASPWWCLCFARVADSWGGTATKGNGEGRKMKGERRKEKGEMICIGEAETRLLVHECWYTEYYLLILGYTIPPYYPVAPSSALHAPGAPKSPLVNVMASTTIRSIGGCWLASPPLFYPEAWNRFITPRLLQLLECLPMGTTFGSVISVQADCKRPP